MEAAKDEAQQKRIERTPVSIDELVQTAAHRGPADFDVRNAVRRDVIAPRPDVEKPQTGPATKKTIEGTVWAAYLPEKPNPAVPPESLSADALVLRPQKFNRSWREDYVSTFARNGRRNE
jgi:hypothetical protein